MKNRIKEMRIAKNINTKQFAIGMKVSRNTVYSWEKGDVRIAPENIKKILDYFNCTFEELFYTNKNDNISNTDRQ